MRYQFVDCRWSLTDPEYGRNAYRQGHIPGASFLDVETDLSAPPGKGRHPLPAAADFAEAAGRAGIGGGVFVVAYGELGGAERLWWLLRHFGHDDCAVIELDAWGGPLRSDDENVQAAVFLPRVRTGDTISLDELVRDRERLLIVDARLPVRWRGEPNPVDLSPGRIPGAVNAPWPEPLPELPEREPVVYCGSGITACIVLHRLHLEGRSGRLYPGSWSEWETYAELPRERGQPA